MILSNVLLLVVFLIGVFIAFYLGDKFGAFRKNAQWIRELPQHRKNAVVKSRAVLGGSFSENLAPFLPGFNYSPTECRFIGKPIDFIVFKGSDDKKIDEVIFVEVKSGKAKLSSQERNLKEAIDKKRVRFEEYRIPEEITDWKELNEI